MRFWGCLHLQAAYAVYHMGAALEPGMVQGRVFQDAWNLLFFGDGDCRRFNIEYPKQCVGACVPRSTAALRDFNLRYDRCGSSTPDGGEVTRAYMSASPPESDPQQSKRDLPLRAMSRP
jgi:hypothetical protein